MRLLRCGFVVDLAVLGKWLDLMVLKGFCNLNDSIILKRDINSAELQTAL